LQYLRHERGQAEHTQKKLCCVARQIYHLGGKTEPDRLEIGRAAAFDGVPATRTRRNLLPVGRASSRAGPGATKQSGSGSSVASPHQNSPRRLSSESVYLEIAALRAFIALRKMKKLLPANVAENLSLPRRWQRLPKALNER